MSRSGRQNETLPDIRSVYYEVTGFTVPSSTRRYTNSITVRCPSKDHFDRSPSCSLDFAKGVYYCHACGRGGGVLDLPIVAGVASDRRQAAAVLRKAGLLR